MAEVTKQLIYDTLKEIEADLGEILSMMHEGSQIADSILKTGEAYRAARARAG